MRLIVDHGQEQWFLWHQYQPYLTQQSKALEYVSLDNPELRFLCRYLRSGMTFLDVGAHHGIFSVLAAKRVGRHGRVISFEPSSRDRRRLTINKVLNRAEQLVSESFALGAHSGPASLFVVLSGYTTMNSLRRPAVVTPVAEVPVRMITLDEYAAEKGSLRIDVMKIDAEGAEIDILSGAERTIERERPIIICEVLDSVAEAWSRVGVDSIKHLEKRSYRWFDFHESGYIRPHRRQSEYPDVRNFLAVPDERLASVNTLVYQ